MNLGFDFVKVVGSLGIDVKYVDMFMMIIEMVFKLIFEVMVNMIMF